MRVILLGAPGAGKGTQSELLAEDFKIPKISTGDMLRAAIAANTSIGQQVKDIIAAGHLVQDTIINALVKDRISQSDCVQGYLFDGYPRTLAQAENLESAGIPIDIVIEIDVSDKEIIERLAGRRIHPSSGRVYHTIYNPPLIAEQDNETHEPLVQREDDKPGTIKKRLEEYHLQTEPLIAWYKKRAAKNQLRYIHIAGTGTVESIYKQIKEELQRT